MHAGLNFVYFLYSFQESTWCSPQYESVNEWFFKPNANESIRIRLEEPCNRAQNYMLHVILNQYFYHLVLSINNHKFNNFTLSTVCKDHNRPAIPWYSSKLYWAVGILLLCKSIV